MEVTWLLVSVLMCGVTEHSCMDVHAAGAGQVYRVLISTKLVQQSIRTSPPRYHAGEDADVTRALTFDYSTPVAIASVSLLASSSSGSHWSLPWPLSPRRPTHSQQSPYEYLWSEVPPSPTPQQQAKQWHGDKPPRQAPLPKLLDSRGDHRAFTVRTSSTGRSARHKWRQGESRMAVLPSPSRNSCSEAHNKIHLEQW
jgi:hypothetical protein